MQLKAIKNVPTPRKVSLLKKKKQKQINEYLKMASDF